MAELMVKMMVYDEGMIFGMMIFICCLIFFLIRGSSGEHLGIENRFLVQFVFMICLKSFFDFAIDLGFEKSNIL